VAKAKTKAEEIVEVVNRAGKKKDRGTVFVSTGSTISNLVLGCGNGLGIETGTLLNIAGRSGGGKSQLIMSIMGCANRDYGDRLIKRLADTENGSNFETVETYGFSLEGREVPTPRTVEEAHADINSTLSTMKPHNIGIYAIDSIDGLLSGENEDAIEERTNAYERGKDYDQGSYGMGKARYLSTTMLPDLSNGKLVNNNMIVIVASQIRDNPNAGLYGVKEIISNGKSLFFYTHVQVWLKKKQGIDSNGVEVGSVVEYKIKKGRGSRGYQSCLVNIYYTMGIDGIATDVDYLYGFRSDETGKLLTNASKPVVWDELTFDNRESLIAYIDENDLLEELKTKVIAKWDGIWEKALAPIAGRKNRYVK
jgi:RecA/RadA recombinase